MKILLVQIKDFENSLENKIKFFFERKNFEVISKTFDLLETAMIPEILLIDSVSIDYMIGVGLAGFFVLSETNSNSKIVINPWMSPSQKLSQKRTVSYDLLTTLKKIETKTYDRVDAEMRVATYGIFTHDANSCDKEMFFKTYGRNMNGVDNYSLMGEEYIYLILENALKYFGASLNSWDYIPGLDPRLITLWKKMLDFSKNYDIINDYLEGIM